MRSSCRRSIITTSAPARPSVHVAMDLDAEIARSRTGSRVDGATTRTCAPSLFRRWMLERATRECRTSPQIATIEALESALVAADGEGIEQRLGWMLMLAVTGIDDGAGNLLGQQLHGAGGLGAAPPGNPGAWH